MTINFQCSSCGRALRVKEQHAGRRVRCPDCQTVLDVPIPASIADRSSDRGAPPPPPSNGLPGDLTGAEGAPTFGAHRSVAARFRKSAKYAVRNGVGSVVAGVLGLAANVLCCVAPSLALMFECAMAVIGILLALNSRGGWKVGGLILNALVLLWAVTMFILILVGVSLQGLQPQH